MAKYPARWGVSPVTLGCPNVSGSYEDIASGRNYESPFPRYGSPDLYAFSLYSLLFGGKSYSAEKVDHVKLSQSRTSLEITAFTTGKVIARRIANFGVDNCKNGFLEIEQPDYDRPASDGLLGIEWNSYNLTTASDGALILRYDSSAVGIYFIPIAGTQSVWFRFPAVSN